MGERVLLVRRHRFIIDQNADYPQDLYLALGAELAGEPDADEAAEGRRVQLEDAQAMIASGRSPAR